MLLKAGKNIVQTTQRQFAKTSVYRK
ncbi:phage tail protein, partial [Escherichia coli]|nr:phage tail protein [Escherichia coli]